MPETLPAGMRVKLRGGYHDNRPGKVVAATDPNDLPPEDGRQYVRVRWQDNRREWVPVDDLEPVTT